MTDQDKDHDENYSTENEIDKIEETQEIEKIDLIEKIENTGNDEIKNNKKSDEGESSKTKVSPVIGEKSLFKSIGNKILSLILAAICLYLIVIYPFSKNDPKKDLNPISANNLSNNDLTPPQLPLSKYQVTHLQEALSTMNTQIPGIENEQQQALKLMQLRMSAPIEVYTNDNQASISAENDQSGTSGTLDSNNTANSNNTTNTTNVNNNNNAVLGGDGTEDANTKFMSKLSSSQAPTQSATRIAHLNTTLTQGNIIKATLETKISSDLPGMVRAITSDDIYSEDDSTLLVPRGSKLIGQYTNNINQGQTRVFVVWQRLIRPDGIDIALNSPGTDPLGTAGLQANNIDHHFWQQFGTASLLSIIGAGTANAGVNSSDQFNSASAYREALASSFNQTAQQSLQNTGVIAPTLLINQGTDISVFVARDLDFYDELNQDNQQNDNNNLIT